MSDHFKNPAYNALHRALLDCTREHMQRKGMWANDNSLELLADVGQARLVIMLVDKLNQLGWDIVRREGV